jgi:cyclic-di-GMP phosphodiesterase, flagellum assembly factor TipF
MGPGSILQIAAVIGSAVAAGSTVYLAGAPAAASAAAALLGGVSAASCIAVIEASRAKRAADARFDTLAAEMVLLRQRQAETDAKLVSVEHRTVDSSGVIWRAATSDIQILGSLVSDLARTVSDHDARLSLAVAAVVPEDKLVPDAKPALDTSRGFVVPQTSPPPPAWFEDEAELGFTADSSPALAEPVPVAAGPIPSPSPAPGMLAELKSTLAAALMSDRLELCLQPYVTLPQRKVVGYEAQLRLKGDGGALQNADNLRAASAAAGMERDLDRILIERAGQVLRVLRSRERVVSLTCAVSGDSILDSAFRSSVEQMSRGDGKLSQSVLLSLPLADIARLRGEGGPAFDALRRTGVFLGVRASQATHIDAAALERLGISELRIGADVLLATAEGAADIHPADLGEMLERRNIRLLVTGADQEPTIRDLLDFAATLAQGEVFGGSRPVRPEVLQPRAVAEPGGTARIKSAKAAEQPPRVARQSFRSLLRRA